MLCLHYKAQNCAHLLCFKPEPETTAGQKFCLYPVKSLDDLTLCLIIYVSNGKSNSELQYYVIRHYFRVREEKKRKGLFLEIKRNRFDRTIRLALVAKLFQALCLLLTYLSKQWKRK